MACATAVVTTREGTEDYAVDGHNALVVPGRDVPALASAIATCLADASLRERLASQAHTDAQQFSWDAGFEQFKKAMSW
jgi:glycosyltransferase involved in cell wall biosynthesis